MAACALHLGTASPAGPELEPRLLLNGSYTQRRRENELQLYHPLAVWTLRVAVSSLDTTGTIIVPTAKGYGEDALGSVPHQEHAPHRVSAEFLLADTIVTIITNVFVAPVFSTLQSNYVQFNWDLLDWPLSHQVHQVEMPATDSGWWGRLGDRCASQPRQAGRCSIYSAF